MADRKPDPLVRFIRKLATVERNSHLSDQELLRRFATDCDQEAFTALVRRHGDLVLRVCRRVLRQSSDVEDAFQATFLVLSRKAGSRRWQASIGQWLCKVAYRLALRANAAAVRRRMREEGTPIELVVDTRSSTSLHSIETVLDEELARLPEALRFPLILCCLEGQPRSEVAQQLGCSEATIGRRLGQARELLRSRLASRGLALSTVLLAAELTNGGAAMGMSALLVGPTVRAAVAFAARQGVLESGISTQAAVWAEGVLQAMVLTKVKLGAVLLAAILMVGTGSALVCQRLASPAAGKLSSFSKPIRSKALAPSEQKKAASVDVYGNSLPDGAVGRLGTVRWRHGAGIPFVAFLQDGKSVLTASYDHTARLWDLVTGKQLRCFKIDVPNHNQERELERSLIISFSNTANLLATSGNGLDIRLHDVATGRERRLLQRPATAVGSLVFSPDGQFLAGAEPDGTIHVWEAATGRIVRRLDDNPIQPGSDSTRDSLTFTRDGKALLWVGVTRRDIGAFTVKIWDFAKGKELRQFRLKGVLSAQPVFSPDGKFLAWASQGDMSIHLTDMVTGKEIRKILAGKKQKDSLPDSFAFSPDSKVLAVQGERDWVVELWEVDTGKRRWLAGMHIQYDIIRVGIEAKIPTSSLAFSDDGKLLAVGSKHNAVRVLDVTRGKELCSIGGHQAPIAMVRFGPDGKTLLSQGEDNTIWLWDIHTRKELRQIGERGEKKTITAVLSQDGRIAAAREIKGGAALRVWDTVTGKDICRIQVKRQIAWYALSPDGRLLTVHMHMCLKGERRDLLFDVATGKEIWIDVPPFNGLDFNFFGHKPIGSIFSPDSQILAIPGIIEKEDLGQFRLYLLDLNRGNLRTSIEVPKDGSLRAAAFSSDGRSLALDLGNDDLTLWEVATGKERCRWKKKPLNAQLIAGISLPCVITQCTRPAESKLAFSPDGKILVEGHLDRTIGIWDVASGQELGVLHGHAGEVQTVAFAPDGKTLASGSVDTTVLLWDVTRWNPGKSAARDLSDRELEACWANLAASDAAKAFQAIVALANAPNQAISFLRKHLQPVPAPDAQCVQRWISDLDSNTFAVRQKASTALEQEGELALPLLRQALKDKKLSQEVNKRLQQIIAKVSSWVVSGERLRQVRAVEALERMGTPEAKQFLQTLAQGAAGALLTREAQAALKRLGR